MRRKDRQEAGEVRINQMLRGWAGIHVERLEPTLVSPYFQATHFDDGHQFLLHGAKEAFDPGVRGSEEKSSRS